jgi:hypothetical protein
VSAQPKAISEIVKDFEQSLENLRPSTRRVHVAGARAAIRAACLELWQCASTTELLASLGKSPTEKRARISPFMDFFRRRRAQELAIRSGLSGSAELGDSKTRKADPLGEKPLHHTPARLGADRRAMRGSGQRNSSKMARKLPQKLRAAKFCCGTRRSRNHASLSPCAFGMPGESAWPDRINGGSTGNLSYGASLDSFSPDQTAPP